MTHFESQTKPLVQQPQKTWVSSATPEGRVFVGDSSNFNSWPDRVWRAFQQDQLLHRSLLRRTGFDDALMPWLYIRTNPEPMESVSSANRVGLADEYYSRINAQLATIKRTSAAAGQGMDLATIESAEKMLNALRQNNLAPPELASQGDDSVVMLWVLGDTTYAITVTGREFGYVVRRDKKRVKIAHSIKIEQLSQFSPALLK